MIALAKLSAGVDGVRLMDVPDPQPGPGEAVVDVIAAGVCDTDALILADRHPWRASVVLGQEVAGVVTAVGSAPDEQWIGARVAVEPLFRSCGTCGACRNGHGEWCADAERMGSTHDGGFAAQVVAPVANLHPAPPRTGEFGVALLRPLASVVNALLAPPAVGAGERVLIVGPATTGFLAAQVARAAGAEVLVSGFQADVLRLEAFADLGFATTMSRTGSGDFDAVIECSGSAAGAVAALEAVRPGGRYVGAGLFGHEVTVPLDQLMLKGVTMTSNLVPTPDAWERAARLIDSGAVDLEAAISEVISLDRWADAFDAMEDGVGMKILLVPRVPVS